MPRRFREEEPRAAPGMRKSADYLYAFGTWDLEPHGVCWVRVFGEEGQAPVIVMGELSQNTSTSVTNMAEYLAPELIQRHFPQRFDHEPPPLLTSVFAGPTRQSRGSCSGWPVEDGGGER